jgi:hypothetical protein
LNVGVDDDSGHPFHPTKQVLVGQIHINDSNGGNDISDGLHLETSKGMTFNAELFLRVMSLCHTVVVERDLDLPKKNNNNNNNSEEKDGGNDGNEDEENPTNDVAVAVDDDVDATTKNDEKSADGAPFGYAYQAESPDEGALVSEGM